MTRPKIGLVLGGGGSRGLAHIGVLEVLVREKIPVDLIVGTSMGAIVGVSYALGHSPERIADAMRRMGARNLLSFNVFSSRGRQRVLEDLLKPVLDDKSFDDLRIPMAVMAVDMISGTEIVLREGPLLPAVLASAAVPALFPPVLHNEMHLADGGVIDSVATQPAYSMGAEKIIVVDVYPPLEQDDPWVDPVSAIMGFQLPFSLFGSGERPPGIAASLWRSFRVMAWHIHAERLRQYPAHVLIRPAVESYGSLDFKDIDGPIEAGAKATEALLGALKALHNDDDP